MNKEPFADDKRRGEKQGVIMAWLYALAAFLNRAFSHSLFKKVFCSYPELDKKLKSGMLADTFGRLSDSEWVKKTRGGIKHFAESNPVSRFFDSLPEHMLKRKSRDYGVYFVMTGVYIIFVYAIKTVMLEKFSPDESSLAVALLFLLLAFMLFRSRTSLSTTLCKNKIFHFITFELLGVKPHELYTEEAYSAASLPLILGMITGTLCFFIPAWTVPAAICGVFVILLVLRRPQSGVVLLLAFYPFIGRALFVSLALLTVVSYLLKLITSKARIELTLCDVFVALWGAVSFITPLFSSNETGYVALVYALLYFALKNTVVSHTELYRCFMAQITAAVLCCGYGILRGIFDGTLYDGTSIFPNAIYSVFDTEVELSLYIVSLIPYALVLFFHNAGRVRRRTELLFVVVLFLFSMLSLNSFASWVTLLVMFVAFMLTYGKKTFAMLLPLSFVFILTTYYVPSDIPQRAYNACSVCRGENMYTEIVSNYGYTALIMLLLTCLAFFGKFLSYITDDRDGFIKKSSLSKIVHAPYLSVLAVLVFGVFEGGVDSTLTLGMLFMHAAVGDGIISCAGRPEHDEYEYYIGGIGL